MARHNKKHDRRKQSASPAKKNMHPVKPEERDLYARKIQIFLKTANLNQMKKADLANKCRSKRSPSAFQAAVEHLQKAGILREERGNYILCERDDCFRAVTSRLASSFGFIRDEEGTEYFVPGRFLLGSMPGDTVLARAIPGKNEGSPEAEVLSILEEAEEIRLAGTIIATENGLCLRPDSMNLEIAINYRESVPYAIGDRVLCLLTERGGRHWEHRVKVLLNFGSADSAANCMESRIAAMGIPVEFSPEALQEAEKLQETGITDFDREDRLNLRDEVLFTIDGAHSKDLDDAVSLQKHSDGSYTLGVHIADVAHYVRPGTALDKEAFERGTSIYYADRVIPMLPKALSNGICSLNAGEERLAFSCIMELSPEGDLLEGKFHKSVICSKVRGVYEECNQILEDTAAPELLEKYAPVREMLFLLDELTTKLEKLRRLRGAPELESTESALMLDENGICIGLAPVQRGRTECIIEACMLEANTCAARLARESEIPFVYRVHEHPSPERMDSLKEMLLRLGAQPLTFTEASPKDIQALLDGCRQEVWFPVINSLTLRAMAKAKYAPEPLGHFGLALRDYAHFTSPIRRYPDLAIHRILTDLLSGAGKDWMQKRYQKFSENASLRSSETEIRAASLERDADASYAAEYMQAHIGEVFQGVITSVTDHGLYVTLENHAEGLLHFHDLPEGEYEVEDGWYVKNVTTGQEFRLGSPLEVICAHTDVAAGHIDLAL